MKVDVSRRFCAIMWFDFLKNFTDLIFTFKIVSVLKTVRLLGLDQ